MTKQGENALVNRQDLQDYMRTGGHDLDPQKAAYCAAFTGAALEHAGVPSMHSDVATSYLNWGKPVTGGIQKGDVLVMSRGHAAGETGGHVGIATGKTNSAGQIEMIAGNTGGIRRGRAVATSFVDPRSVTARRYDSSNSQASNAQASNSQAGVSSTSADTTKSTDKKKPSFGKKVGKALQEFGENQPKSKEPEPEQPQSPLDLKVGEQGSQAQENIAQSRSQEFERASHLLDAPQIQSQEQLARLKPGQAFRGPDGKLRWFMPGQQATQAKNPNQDAG